MYNKQYLTSFLFYYNNPRNWTVSTVNLSYYALNAKKFWCNLYDDVDPNGLYLLWSLDEELPSSIPGTTNLERTYLN